MARFELYILVILVNIYGCICGDNFLGSVKDYFNEFEWIGSGALMFVVIINLMICSVYWCCTKEKWSPESAKKVMTNF